MKAAELIALAAAHGIDLSHVGGNADRTDGAASLRRRSREELRDGIEVIPTARGHGTRTYRRPAWSLAELGQAAQGLGELPWFAARYSFAGDRSCYWTLWYALAFEAHALAHREGWQPRVMGCAARDPRTGRLIAGARGEPRFYLLDLAQLVLDEDGNRSLFAGAQAIAGLHALYLRVEEPTWSKILEPRYRSLQAVYERWLGTARGMIQRRLNESSAPSATLHGPPRRSRD